MSSLKRWERFLGNDDLIWWYDLMVQWESRYDNDPDPRWKTPGHVFLLWERMIRKSALETAVTLTAFTLYVLLMLGCAWVLWTR